VSMGLFLDILFYQHERRGVSAFLDMHIHSYEQRYIWWWVVGLVGGILFCGGTYSHATDGRWPRSLFRSVVSVIRPHIVSSLFP
jgi:hypothetical protein